MGIQSQICLNLELSLQPRVLGHPLSSQTALFPLLPSLLGGAIFQPVQLPEKRWHSEAPNPVPGITVYFFKLHSSPNLPRCLTKMHKGHREHIAGAQKKVGLVWICSRVRLVGEIIWRSHQSADVRSRPAWGRKGTSIPRALSLAVPNSWVLSDVATAKNPALHRRGGLEPHVFYAMVESWYNKIGFRAPHLLTAIWQNCNLPVLVKC